MSTDLIVNEIVKKVSYFGLIPTNVIVDNKETLITWSPYCVTCTRYCNTLYS